MHIIDVDSNSVPSFSKKDKAYLTNSAEFKQFIKYDFNIKEIDNVIANRKKYKTNRALLHSVILEQYKDVNISTSTKLHIENILKENSFTITTAHQPSLFTGPLYYIFKILSTIKLCKVLQTNNPENNFVPVFIIGAEDHDFEEINHFSLFNKKISWDTDQKGATGRFNLEGLTNVLNVFKDIIGDNIHLNGLISDIESFISTSQNYAEFSFKLTHRIFDHLGIVILRMDDKRLKNEFKEIIKKEITERPSKNLIQSTQEKLENLGYKSQAFVRDINLFYLNAEGRNRIEFDGNKYNIINNANLSFTTDEMIDEINNFPERFSPNVIIRPLYQEFTLPNLAYIGGGGELAYWMERKTQFDHFGLHFPMLIRRNSATVVSSKQVETIEKLGFKVEEIFLNETDLINQFISRSDSPDFDLTTYKRQIENVFSDIQNVSKSIDNTLSKTVQSEMVKSTKSIDYIQSKLKKAVKQKEEININRIKKIKAKLCPNGLQERHDNFFELASRQGLQIVDDFLPYFNPFDKTMKVIVI